MGIIFPWQVVKTAFLENGAFVTCRKQMVLTKNGENRDFDFYTHQKKRALLLAPRKPTKMTKMAGVTQAKPPFAKNSVFATANTAATTTEVRAIFGALNSAWPRGTELNRNHALLREHC